MSTAIEIAGTNLKAIILLNGEPYQGKIDDKNARVYCCDGAYGWAKNRVRIDENLGDFDSLSYLPEPPPEKVYPSEKNSTDGELALCRAIDAGAKHIEIYGGGGKREDHFLGNLHLLYAAAERGVFAEMITNYARIFFHSAQGSVRLSGLKGKTVSVIPFGGEAHILNSSGFYYPLPEKFAYGSTRGISNVVIADEARFTLKSGAVLVFVNEDV